MKGVLSHLSETERALLTDRARALSRTPPEQSRAHLMEVVALSRNGTSYAIEATLVREVARLVDVTVVPGAPPPFAGVVAIRGTIVPLADLGLLVGTPGDRSPAAFVVVVADEHADLGLLADTVDEVTFIESAAVHPPPAALGELGFAVGITGTGLVVISGRALLDDPRLFVGRPRDRAVGHPESP